MKQFALLLSVIVAACVTSAGAGADTIENCPPNGYDRARLEVFKAGQWSISDPAERDRFARAMPACLASPDPAVRDSLAFEALQRLMRNRELSGQTMMALQDELETMLRGPPGPGFAQPFAALALAEVARADRIEPYLDAGRRTRLAGAAADYLASVSDYRGFDEGEGWRHGVAHGADLALQLTLNPAIERTDIIRLRDAIALQAAQSERAYVFGEADRLAAPIIFMARRGLFTREDWRAWFAQVVAPAPFASWDGVFSSSPMLRKRHNLIAFLHSVYVSAALSENRDDDVLAECASEALRTLP